MLLPRLAALPYRRPEFATLTPFDELINEPQRRVYGRKLSSSPVQNCKSLQQKAIAAERKSIFTYFSSTRENSISAPTNGRQM